MDEKDSVVRPIPASAKPNWSYIIGLAILWPLNVYLLYIISRIQDQGIPETLGALTGQLFFLLLLLGIACIWKKFRNRATMVKVAFFTSLYLAFSNFVSISHTNTELLQEKWRRPDPALYQIDPEQIKGFAATLQGSVQRGTAEDISHLFDRDHFVRQVIRASSHPSIFVKKFAQGAAVPLSIEKPLQQISQAIQSGARFSLVKTYHKEQPVLQYRLSGTANELHYFDFYLIRDSGLIRIEDYQFYTMGQRVSARIAELAEFFEANPREPLPLALAQADSVMDLRNAAAVTDWLNLFSPVLQQSRLITRLAIDLYQNAGDATAARLALTTFSELFPDDPSLPFLRYNACAEQNDLDGMLQCIDEMYRLVGGDTTLLLLKVKLLALQGKHDQAIQQLDFTVKAFHIPVKELYSVLPKEFLHSKPFKKWLAK